MAVAPATNSGRKRHPNWRRTAMTTRALLWATSAEVRIVIAWQSCDYMSQPTHAHRHRSTPIGDVQLAGTMVALRWKHFVCTLKKPSTGKTGTRLLYSDILASEMYSLWCHANNVTFYRFFVILFSSSDLFLHFVCLHRWIGIQNSAWKMCVLAPVIN